MILQGSFVIRLWSEMTDRGSRNVFQLTHIQTGETRHSSNLGEVLQWIEIAAARSQPTPAGNDEDGEDNR